MYRSILVNPKYSTYTVIFTTFAINIIKNEKKKEKNWKNSLYEFPLLLKSLFRHSVIAHVRFVADDFMLTQARKNII